MSRIKLNLRQPIPDKLQTGRQIIAAMTNNPNFATPHPPLADVNASLTTLDEAYKAHQIAKSEARAKANVADDAEIQLDSQLRKLAAYVESIADKDETIIASAGMQTKDAHGLYEQFGFIQLHRPERWMERPDPNMKESPDYWQR